MSEAPPIPLPELPPRYRLWPEPAAAALGSGGAATVWRVQDTALGVLVALKVLRSTSPGFLARMEREAVLASRVVHPSVVGLHDMGRTPDGRGYLAFALANEGSMLDLAPQPPAWPELKDLFLQLLQALAALHARGILHLDVKLSNLLLHRPGRAGRELWLADLGVARALGGEDDHDKSVVGTVSYMAPERLTGQHHLWCPATDLFAVGAVVYRLLTGRLPYPAKDPNEGMAQRERPPRALRPRAGLDLPPGVEEFVLPMIEPDPRARFDLCADAIRALLALGEPAPPAPEPTAPLTWGRLVERARAAGNPAGRALEAPAAGVPPWFRPPLPKPPYVAPTAGASRRVPQAPSLLVHREIRLVGRDPELELLQRTARATAQRRRPVLVEVSGPPGSGRTRLLQEFTRGLEESGLGEGVRMAYAVRGGADAGLRGAWRRIFPPGSLRSAYEREIAATFARDRGCTLDECAADARLLAEFVAPSPSGPAPRRAAVRAMLVEHLARRAWRGVSWLWLEDVDLAGVNDDAWPVVDQLLASDAPVMVLVTTRADRVSPSLLELRARHHRLARTIALEPLPGPSAEALVHAHLPLAPALAARLARHAGGNPGAVKELLAHWVRTDALRDHADADAAARVWDLRPGAPPFPADRRAFAEARFELVRGDDTLAVLLGAFAAAGDGVPESVMYRINPSGVDRMLVDGLLELRQGRLFLQPPELADVLEAHAGAALPVHHARVAEAWAAEPADPEVWRQVGLHRLRGGQAAAALDPLDRALAALCRTLPVPELAELAQALLQAAAAHRDAGGPSWARAALALADARWRAGDAEAAAALDARVAEVELAPADALAALCARARRADRDLRRALDELAGGERLLPHAPAPRRADWHATAALLKARSLDVDGALEHLLDALSLRPDPEVECRARLLRARLLQPIEPMVSWHEALRVVELGRDHGLIRHEVLAWGVAGEAMVMLGRADEAVERLRAGLARLEAHGEVRMASEARLQLGAAQRAAGRDRAAAESWRAALDAPPPALGTTALDARAHLGVLAVLSVDPESLAALSPMPLPLEPAARAAWSLLGGLMALMDDDPDAAAPSAAAVASAVALGVPGLFLARVAVAELERAGRGAEATPLDAALREVCRRDGVDLRAADPWFDRYLRARG